MLKKIQGWALLGAALLLSGCATSGRNYQTDIDALNARVTALQGQLAAKDQELSTLQTKADDERLAREATETALRTAQNENKALSQSSKTSEVPASDLK